MRILLLGPVQVVVAGRPVKLGPSQHRLLLAVLALEVNRLVPVDRLVELVWPMSPPRSAAHAIVVGISRLRGLLSSLEPSGVEVELTRQGRGYVLRTDPAVIDAHRFTALVGRVRREDDDVRRVALLDEALQLWNGPAMSGTAATDEVRHRLCHGLEEARLVALEDRIEARLGLAEHREAISELTDLVGAHPLRERLAGQLIRALYRCGRPGDALAAYQRIRQALADELGLEPGTELRQLQVAILRNDAALDPPTPPSVGTRPTNTPAQLPSAIPSFVGRAAELDQLDQPLAGQWQDRPAVIVSIHGAPGVGKTALAVHWAHRVCDRFPDGQLYVNLRGFDPTGSRISAADALHGFLTAFGIPAEGVPPSVEERTALYRRLLSNRRALVVVDNATDAEHVRPLLPGSPGCLAVVTSRYQLTSLIVEGAVHPLTLDLLSATEARELLVRRLGVKRTAAEAGAIDDIVRLTARLPLALAIVAARAATRPRFRLSVVAAELSQAPGDLEAFDVVDVACGLRAAFSASYQSLSAANARMFRLMGLQPGPDLTAPAAASLAGVPLRQTRAALIELTRAHLVTEHLPGRYTQHDLLRAYATELADEHDDTAERHAARLRILDHYLHTAHAAARLLPGARELATLTEPGPGVVPERLAHQRQALAWLSAERPVLGAAIRAAADADCEFHAVRLAAATATFLGRQARWLELIDAQLIALRVARRRGDRAAQAEAHSALGRAEARLGRHDSAHAHLRQAFDLFDAANDRAGQAHIHDAIAFLLSQQERHREALNHAERSLDLFRAAGHRAGEARALNNIGWDHLQLGDHRRAIAYCKQALSAFRDLADRYGEAYSCHSLADAYRGADDHAEAIAAYQTAIDLYRDTGERYLATTALTGLGRSHRSTGEPARAREVWREALMLLRVLDHPDAKTLQAMLDDLDRPAMRRVTE